jgi:hypothetical protein
MCGVENIRPMACFGRFDQHPYSHLELPHTLCGSCELSGNAAGWSQHQCRKQQILQHDMRLTADLHMACVLQVQTPGMWQDHTTFTMNN